MINGHDVYDMGDEQPEENSFLEFESIKHETEKAVLFNSKYGMFWLPKKYITIIGNVVHYESWVTVKYVKQESTND